MSTISTAPADEPRPRDSWPRRLGIPALAAVLIGAVGGGAFYYFVEIRGSSVRHTNPAAARRVATTHTLVAIGGGADESAAFALVGRADGDPFLLPISSSLVVQVPGVGPRTMTLALRQAGPGGAAVGLANALRVMVPSSVSAPGAVVATTVDAAGGAKVDVPQTLQSSTDGVTRVVFTPGRTEMSGAEFVRYMTGRYIGEDEAQRDARELSGWRAFLESVGSGNDNLLRRWTVDTDAGRIRRVLRSASDSPKTLRLPLAPIELADERLVRLDESHLASLREQLGGISNGAETVDGRRVRVVIGADGSVGLLVGRILVNAGYVVELSGKSARRTEITRIGVSASVPDAESTGKDIAGLLGMGSIRVSTDSDTAADIMLVIGMDWAEANGFPQR